MKLREAREKDELRKNVVMELLEQEDPTKAALVLLEVEEPDEMVLTMMNQVLNSRIALMEFTEVIDISSNGNYVLHYSGLSDNGLKMSRTDGTGETYILPVPGQGALLSSAFSSDGSHVAIARGDGRVYLLRTDDADAEPVVLPVPGKGRISSIALSSDGNYMALVTSDGRAFFLRTYTDAVLPQSPLELSGQGRILDVGIGWDGKRPDVFWIDQGHLGRDIEQAHQVFKIAILAVTRACLDPSFRVQSLDEEMDEARRAYEACERSWGR